MENEELEDLLLYISDRESNPLIADKAFTILYKRFGEFVYNSIYNTIFFSSIKEKEVFADTVTNNTFLEINAKPLSFAYDATKHKSQDKGFKVYLAAIAKNEKNDLLRESINYNTKQLKIIDDDKNFFEPSITDEDYEKLADKLSTNQRILEEILTELSERDRFIILTYYDNFEEGKNTPSQVLDDIENLYGTTRENIRMIRNRVKAKIIKHIESKTGLKAI